MGKISFVVPVSLLALALVPAWGSTWYVDGSVSASGDGKSWATPFKNTQEGIDAALNGDTVNLPEARSIGPADLGPAKAVEFSGADTPLFTAPQLRGFLIDFPFVLMLRFRLKLEQHSVSGRSRCR